MRIRVYRTKPVLASSRSQSAGSERTDGQQDYDDTPNVETKPTITAMTSVLASLNKMKMIRERAHAAKGNVTSDRPLRKFCPEDVTREIERILATALMGVTYDPKRAGILCKSLSDTIKNKVKAMKYPRYKFVAVVTISSQSNQSMMSASRCLWSTEFDTYATGTYSNTSLIAVATLFAIFME